MAHGYTNPVPTFVCIDGGKYLIKDRNNQFVEHYFSKGDKVDFSGAYGYFSSDPCDIEHRLSTWHSLSQEQIDNTSPENVYYEFDESYYGDLKYISKTTVERSFRPIVHKHLAAMECSNIDSLNAFLKTLPIDNLKDVKELNNGNFLVIYVDMGDE